MDDTAQWAKARVDGLTARIERIVEESGYKKKSISARAGQRDGWLSMLLQGWRGKGRRGRAPSLETLLLLAQGMNTTVGELLGEEFLSEPRRDGAGPTEV